MMKIEQKKLSNTHTFSFHEQNFNFSYSDRSGSGGVDVAYANLAVKTSTRIEDNSWWRNAGYVWCGIGVANVGFALAAGQSLAGRAFWVYVGLACLAVYVATRVKYTVIGYGHGSVFVIQDNKTHDKILHELMSRRKAHLLSLYGEIDLESDLEREKAKISYLVAQGAISQDEADDKLRQAATAFGAWTEGAPRVLN